MGFEMLDRIMPSANTEKVVISRHWDHPEITVTVSRDRITVITDLDTFVDGLIAELNIPPQDPPKLGRIAKMLLGDLAVYNPERGRLEGSIRAAADKAIEKIKDATAQVM